MACTRFTGETHTGYTTATLAAKWASIQSSSFSLSHRRTETNQRMTKKIKSQDNEKGWMSLSEINRVLIGLTSTALQIHNPLFFPAPPRHYCARSLATRHRNWGNAARTTLAAGLLPPFAHLEKGRRSRMSSPRRMTTGRTPRRESRERSRRRSQGGR